MVGNLNTMRNIVRTMRDKYGMSSNMHYFTAQGPHPLQDTFVMFVSCVMLKHSLNAGINKANVQFGTMR
jgi:hypothetical protein